MTTGHNRTSSELGEPGPLAGTSRTGNLGSEQLGFEQLVFAGGGTRCLWQGGFLEVLRPRLAFEPVRVCGVSGGALGAACYLAGCGDRMLEALCEAFASLDHNVTWRDLIRGKGITPHQRVYRRVIAKVLDAEAAKRIGDGPSFQVLIAHPVLGRRSRLAGLLPATLYELELHLVSRPHLRWAQRVGLEANLVDARQVAREGQLADLVCAAATVPPFFDLPCWDGQLVLDAGMANQAPMPEPDEGRTLILLTREYRNLPREPRKVYVWPSRETPADKLDFTDPGKLRRTWDLGARDARAVLARWAGENG